MKLSFIVKACFPSTYCMLTWEHRDGWEWGGRRGRTANTNAFEPDMQEVLWDFKLVTVFPRKVRKGFTEQMTFKGGYQSRVGLWRGKEESTCHTKRTACAKPSIVNRKGMTSVNSENSKWPWPGMLDRGLKWMGPEGRLWRGLVIY